MKRIFRGRSARFTAAIILFMLAFFVLPQQVSASGEHSVYGATPPSVFTLYALDPDLVAGWNTPLRDYEKKYIPEKYHRLPVLGGWYGEGFIPDRETLLASGLKKSFYLNASRNDKLGITKTLEKLGMEVTVIAGHSLKDMPECFRSMGRAFNRLERGEELAAYAEESLNKVKLSLMNLPDNKKKRVYLALETDGLATVCRQSERSEVLDAAGAVSVHECPAGAEEAFLRITFEQLMSYNPEVILIFHPDLMEKIKADDRWQRLEAVRENRSYFIPRGPFSWLERPATYMRLLGVQWLANKLHPTLYPIDIKSESKKFMKLFFNLDLTENQLNDLFKEYGTF